MQTINAAINTQESLQSKFIKNICDKNIPIKLFLRNGIALKGYIAMFDNEVIFLKNEVTQLVYKGNIVTIMPSLDL